MKFGCLVCFCSNKNFQDFRDHNNSSLCSMNRKIFRNDSHRINNRVEIASMSHRENWWLRRESCVRKWFWRFVCCAIAVARCTISMSRPREHLLSLSLLSSVFFSVALHTFLLILLQMSWNVKKTQRNWTEKWLTPDDPERLLASVFAHKTSRRVKKC